MLRDGESYKCEQLIQNYACRTLRDIVKLANVNRRSRDVLEWNPMIGQIIAKICPPKTPKRVHIYDSANKYYTLLMMNILPVMSYRNELGINAPLDWQDMNTLLECTKQLDKWSGLELNSRYEIIGLTCRFWPYMRMTHFTTKKLGLVTTIGNNFSRDYEFLASVDLSGLKSVQFIGSVFMAQCKSLTRVDMHGLLQLKEIPDFFLLECPNLILMNLSGLTSVNIIGCSVFAYCRSLKNINLDGLTNVENIGSLFLADCHSLEKLDMSCMVSLKSIGFGFLNNCHSLESINFSDLLLLEHVGPSFMIGCHSIKMIDVRNASNLIKNRTMNEYKQYVIT